MSERGGMALVKTVLAHGPGRPNGDTEVRLDLRVGLTAQSHIDVPAYLADPEAWIATRSGHGPSDWTGELIQIDDGFWALRSRKGDVDPVWDLSVKTFRPGEYVTLHRPDGEELIFLIVNVDLD